VETRRRRRRRRRSKELGGELVRNENEILEEQKNGVQKFRTIYNKRERST
jgi:hypothetical protein